MLRMLPERNTKKPEIVLTNLIDVILLMVFFFMITTSFAKQTQKIPLQLPTSSTAVVTGQENLTVQVGADGRMFVGKDAVTLADVPAKIGAWVQAQPDRPVVLEADVKLDYGKVVQVLEAIRQGGGQNIGISTIPEKKRG